MSRSLCTGCCSVGNIIIPRKYYNKNYIITSQRYYNKKYTIKELKIANRNVRVRLHWTVYKKKKEEI